MMCAVIGTTPADIAGVACAAPDFIVRRTVGTGVSDYLMNFWLEIKAMNSIIFYIAMTCASTPFVIIAFLFFYFIINNKKYKNLLSMYDEQGFTLTPLYQFYVAMGFLGSFGMAYYFCRLKKNKKVIFPPDNKETVTIFLNKIDLNYTAWLKNYYLATLTALLIYSIFIILSILKIILDTDLGKVLCNLLQ